MSRRKNNSLTAVSIKLAIVIIVTPLLFIIFYDWRFMLVYREIKANRTETVKTSCSSVVLDYPFEMFRRDYYHYCAVYNVMLRDGTTVSIYKDIADDIFPSREAMEQQLVTGGTKEFTYITKPRFSNGAFVLLSVSDDGKVIIDKADVVQDYYRILKRDAIMLLVAFCMALLSLMPPLGFYLHRKLKRRKRLRDKQRKKLSKMRNNPKQQ